MYFALVRPLLEYASSVWDPHITSDIHKIEMVQRRAARFVIGNYSKTSGTVTNILQQLNWPLLEQSRKESRLINLYKIQYENIATPLPDYIQRQRASITRQYHPSKFSIMGPKTNVYKYSYFPRTILEWNSLRQSLYDIHNLDNFKTVLIDSRMLLAFSLCILLSLFNHCYFFSIRYCFATLLSIKLEVDVDVGIEEPYKVG